MSKTTITRLFIGSGVAIVAGAILAIAAVWLAIANDAFVMNGTDIVGFQAERARLDRPRARTRRPGGRRRRASSAAWSRGSAR